MLPSLKAAFTLLSLLQLTSSRPVTSSTNNILKEIIILIRELSSRVQIPCNDTRVAEVPFKNQEMPEGVLLCQANKVLTNVTRCEEAYEPLITNLRRLHFTKNCSLSHDEIYLRRFLPELGNFTQGLYRRRRWSAAQ